MKSDIVRPVGTETWGKVLEPTQIRQLIAQKLAVRLGARARLLFALVPTLITFWAGACFVWNHFLVGPYLLDSGWYSAIIYQHGLLPDNPLSVRPVPEYYGIHVSPLISFASLASYLLPIGRVPYYCLFQGLIYAPLGAVTAMLARVKGADATVGGASRVLLVSILFAFNGQAMACLGYPHYEIFLSAGLCILLAGIATGQSKLAWLGLVLAAATREDGGFHALAFTVAALACSLSGRPFPLERRTLVRMAIGAAAMSAVAVASQKLFFESANLFRHEYLGEPMFAHLTMDTLKKRLLALPDDASFILFPLLGTIVLAVIARDGRYLLGWFVELPWLLVNFLAAQELKAHFSIYTGFPFVGSVFWVAAYGQVARPLFGRSWWLGGLAVVSFLSTIGLYHSRPAAFVNIVKSASMPGDASYSGISRFAGDLEKNPNAYGAILVDPAMAAWTIQSMPPERIVADVQRVVAPQEYDGIAYFKRGRLGPQFLRFLEKSHYSRCGGIPNTDVVLCVRDNRELPPQFRGTALGG